MKQQLDFIGIGGIKCGTTWLYEILNQHPDISFGTKKEINFFNDKVLLDGYLKREYNYKKGIGWYIKQLNLKEDKLNGEISPNYIWDEKVAYRIKKHFPNIKLIAILRNPIQRAISDYYYMSTNLYIAKDFEDATKKYPPILERGLYHQQLKIYYSLFNKKNIKVMLFDDLKKDPKQFITEIYKFLGVKQIPPDNIHNIVHKTKASRFKALPRINATIVKMNKTKLGHSIHNSIPFKETLGKLLYSSMLRFRKELKKKTVEPQVIKRLNKYYHNDINKLQRLIKRDLSDWQITR